MKWAPNKKLHFEVAIIKAIQSLGQATLDEVIEKLGELRTGGGGSPLGVKSSKPVPVGARSVPESRNSNRTGDSESMQRAVGAAGKNNTRSEDKPQAAESEVDPEKIWEAVLAKIPIQKAFLRNSAAAAHVLGVEGRNFSLGFAPGEKAMMDILGTQANRKFVESLLHEISGKDWALKLTINEALASKAALAAEDFSSRDFKNEPLIQEAIELFNARVRP
jgi:DNA polymerase-3 subunit gamma/tau